MTLVFEIGALIIGSVFLLVYTLDKLFEWGEMYRDKEEEEKEDKELRELSKHMYS